MGAASSISAEHFLKLKEEYELKKANNLSDDQLYLHMKDFYDEILSETIESDHSVTEKAVLKVEGVVTANASESPTA